MDDHIDKFVWDVNKKVLARICKSKTSKMQIQTIPNVDQKPNTMNQFADNVALMITALDIQVELQAGGIQQRERNGLMFKYIFNY